MPSALSRQPSAVSLVMLIMFFMYSCDKDPVDNIIKMNAYDNRRKRKRVIVLVKMISLEHAAVQQSFSIYFSHLYSYVNRRLSISHTPIARTYESIVI